MNESNPSGFAEAASEKQSGVVGEFIHFIAHNKKYWMIPLLVVLLTLGGIIIAGSTAAAPFIYTLF